MTSGASTTTGAVDSVFLFIIGVSVFFLVLITVLMIYFIFKYHKSRHTKAKDIEGNTALEVLWTVIPTIIVLVMFYLGWKGFEVLRNVPDNALEVTVNARMWSWLFEYENGGTSETLKVPVNTPVKLHLKSQDVLHSFFIPAFRVKEDAVPGLNNYLWFNANETGKYNILCAEYCGLQHAYMLSKVEVVGKEEYDAWYAELGSRVAETPIAPKEEKPPAEVVAVSGKLLAKSRGCMACHTTDGSKLVGPSFQGLFGSEVVVLEGGKEKTIKADEEYMRRSILKPNQEIVKGYQGLMPSQEGLLTEEQLVALIQYLKEL